MLEIVLTDHIEDFNKRKRKKFKEMGVNKLEYKTPHKLEPDIIYRFDMER